MDGSRPERRVPQRTIIGGGHHGLEVVEQLLERVRGHRRCERWRGCSGEEAAGVRGRHRERRGGVYRGLLRDHPAAVGRSGRGHRVARRSEGGLLLLLKDRKPRLRDEGGLLLLEDGEKAWLLRDEGGLLLRY